MTHTPQAVRPVPRSFHEILHVTSNLEKQPSLSLIDISLEDWITEVAIPDKRLERFATFTVVEGLVWAEDVKLPVRSERADCSGYTYINGKIAHAKQADINRLIGKPDIIVAQALEQVARYQNIGKVVMGRYGCIYLYDESRDNVLSHP